MPVTILPIANGFYESSSLPISAQECVNWYPNIPQAPALNSETLFGTPGATQVDTAGDLVNCRGARTVAGIPYFVIGEKLYSLDRTIVDDAASYSLTEIGDIAGSGRVSLADNGVQLCILSPGGSGYIYDTGTTTLTEITDVDFRASGDPQYVVELDGYFVFTTDENKFIVSAINDGLSYNALDFGSGEKVKGNLVSILAYQGQIYLFGEYSFATYNNQPSGADFPFVWSGLTVDKGLDSPFSIIESSGTFMFVGGAEGESPAIWMYQENNVAKVSTTAIDSILQREDVAESFAWSYAQSGAYFTGFTFQSTSLVYDSVTQRWHERKSEYTDVVGVKQFSRYRHNALIEAYGLILCGDALDGQSGNS